MTRVLLDAHVSGRVIGETLSGDGHDVRAIDSEEDLEGLPDREVLSLAVSEGRVLVTANVRDFLLLISERAAGSPQGAHAGCILIPRSIRNQDFAALIAGIRAALDTISQEEWADRVEWIRKRTS